ncbi:MAG: cobyrinic acid ac-diamide synthase [Bacteroidetes bacterium]|nr:MAG: cobyrinic acid ac-diamide synthase [Bacteroidota bacterium]
MAKVISVINNKGGTGKTTTVLNLGAALARRNKRVLLLDLDSQCNLTSALGISEEQNCVGEALLGRIPLAEAVMKVGRLSIVPANAALVDSETQLSNEPGREFILREALADLHDGYDFIVMDCPPSMSVLSINSLVAADHYLVPMQAENFAFIGLDRILQVAEKVKQRMNPQLELAGILFVKLNPRTNFSRAMIKSLSEDERLAGRLFDTYIRQDISLMESGAFHQTVFDYAPKGNGSADYGSLAREILKIYG